MVAALPAATSAQVCVCERERERGYNLCGRAPLVLAPHTIACMGVESFTEENRRSITCGPCISL